MNVKGTGTDGRYGMSIYFVDGEFNEVDGHVLRWEYMERDEKIVSTNGYNSEISDVWSVFGDDAAWKSAPPLRKMAAELMQACQDRPANSGLSWEKAKKFL